MRYLQAFKSWFIPVTLLLSVAAGSHYVTLNMINAEESPDVSRPLYWVAPMDPSYRRDVPGKSPMGMDLVPVYAEGVEGAATNPGVVSISPDVVNNLGVRTAIAEYRTLPTEINALGYVRFDEDELIHIHSRVEGWVEKLFVTTQGAEVTGGQPLYTLYSPKLVNAQEELVLAANRDDQELISAAEARLVALQVDRATINDIKERRVVQQALTFYAPKTGVLNELNIRQGFFIQPGMTLMSIGILEEVWVEAEIFESQSAQLHTGFPVTITSDYLPGRSWPGAVDYVYPSVDSTTRTFRLRVKLSNRDTLLKPNMFVNMRIEVPSDQNVLAVPYEAVIRTGSQNRVVLALGNGQFKSLEVSIGASTSEFVEILSGVRPGDRVVTSAQFLLDSESSRSSDFVRMDHGEIDHSGMDHSQMNHGEMDHSGMDHSQMNHGEMDHSGMDHSQMNHSEMNHGEMDHSGMDHTQMNQGEMDHSGMDHSQMNHGEMDHSGMDHSQMNHGEMDHSGMDHSQMNHGEMGHSGIDHSQMNHGDAALPEDTAKSKVER